MRESFCLFFLCFSCLVFSTKMAIAYASRGLCVFLCPDTVASSCIHPCILPLPFNNINTMPVPFKANEHDAQAIRNNCIQMAVIDGYNLQ
jgi:hypothetical protein